MHKIKNIRIDFTLKPELTSIPLDATAAANDGHLKAIRMNSNREILHEKKKNVATETNRNNCNRRNAVTAAAVSTEILVGM